MAYINGRKVLQVVQVTGGGGGSDAELNLAYGLTPPSDTTKLWVKILSEPSNVKITNEARALIDNEVATQVNIDLTISPYTLNQSYACKIGNYIYTSYVKGKTTGINLSSYGRYRITRINLTTGVMDYILGSGTSLSYYVLAKKDDNSFYYITYASSTYKLYIYDITTGTSTQITDFPTSWNNTDLQLEGDYIYYRNGTTGFKRWSFITKLVEDINFTFPNGSIKNNVVIKNGKIYLPMQLSGQSQTIGTTTYYKRYTQIYCYDIDTQTLQDTGYTFKKIITGTTSGQSWVASASADNGFLVVINGTPKIYGGFSEYLYSSSSRYGYATKYWIENVVGCVDNTDVYLLGGLTYGTSEWSYNATESNITNYSKYAISWALTENNLLLSTYKGSGVNFPIISTETITIEFDFSFAYLGDSNNIAQAVDMLYYDNSLWKGINCLGYTQLEDCSISAEDVSIDLASATTDTQTITITPTWNDQTGTYNVSVASSDSAIATASLSGTTLTITGVAVGSATITISVVDAYGTTFTKDITATITNSAA